MLNEFDDGLPLGDDLADQPRVGQRRARRADQPLVAAAPVRAAIGMGRAFEAERPAGGRQALGTELLQPCGDPGDLLVPLSELGVASAKGHPDARGWEVLATGA